VTPFKVCMVFKQLSKKGSSHLDQPKRHVLTLYGHLKKVSEFQLHHGEGMVYPPINHIPIYQSKDY